MSLHLAKRGCLILGAVALSAVLVMESGIASRVRAADDVPAALELTQRTPLAVDASSLEVRVTDTSPHDYPYVGWRAPVPYDQAIKGWAALRFGLTGQSVNVLRITLRQGTIVEKLLPITTGISGWFKKEQGAEYRGTLDVVVEVVDPNGAVLASADAKAWATESVSEKATQADKEKAWSNVTRTTFDNLDNELLPRMHQVMAAYLRSN